MYIDKIKNRTNIPFTNVTYEYIILIISIRNRLIELLIGVITMTAMVMERPQVKTKTMPNKVHTTIIQRKEIWMADLSGSVGSEQAGVRPVICTQNWRGNHYSPTTQVVPLTTSESKAKLPTHIQLEAEKTNLHYNSVALVEQQRVIDKNRLLFKVGEVDDVTMKQIGKAIIISYELEEYLYN
jgi:mRNA interferase MazF